ncbi:MFS transporter [Herbiconiux moechotypicola]|uniref:MFS transporter n=1 Tax=Herbiconiux moechotypicola TaxID=637393 RepID=A0ABN3E1M0_9MICO|nr:MFS transporter [Herbiconiux moechotypicola]MCS5731341.1 MFS transporter [Herbiconiux moechotypicola]
MADQPKTPPFPRRLAVPMVIGAVLNPVNTSIIAVALVPIGVALGAPADETAWLISALFIATAVGQPLAGRLADTLGPRRLYLAGAILTVVAGVIGALAPTIWVLVGARVVLGLGTSAAYPASIAMLGQESRRSGRPTPGSVLTLLAIAGQTVAVVGPTLGGALIELGGWRATLALNVPLGLLSLILGVLWLPRDRPRGTGTGAGPRVDVVGVLLFTVTLVTILIFIKQPSAIGLWLLVVAVAAAACFVARELRTVDPFIDLRVLAGSGQLLVVYLQMFLSAIVTYSFIFGFTQWLEGGRGLSPAVAGLILLPSFASGLLIAAVTGRSKRFRGKLVVSAVAQIVGVIMLLLVRDGAELWYLILIAIVMGIPQGLVNVGTQSAVYELADQEKLGAAAGLLRAFMYLGAITSSALGGIAFSGGHGADQLRLLSVMMLTSALLFGVLLFARRPGQPAVARD